MASTEDQIAWLEAEIKRLKDELKRMKEQRDTLTKLKRLQEEG